MFIVQSFRPVLWLTCITLYSSSASLKSFNDHTEWQNSVGSWNYAIESWPSNGESIDSLPIVLPSGTSFNLVPSTGVNSVVVKSAKDYLNLILMYGDNSATPNIIVYDTDSVYGSPVKLTFTTPISSFGFDMEPTSFGNYEMSVIVNEDFNNAITLTQVVSSNEELANPTFFGFTGDANNMITSLTLISYDSSLFVICRIVEGLTISPPTVIPTSSPMSTVAADSLYSNLGCYADGNPRAMKQLKELGIYNTIETCSAAAAAKGYSYFALQWGGECWVSNSLIESEKYLSSNKCNMQCRSNTKQQCGGSFANSLFCSNIQVATTKNPTVIPTISPVTVPTNVAADAHYTSLGCYADGNPRAMKQLKALGIYNTAETCYAAAVAKDYSLFALQWGGECWVSRSLIDSEKYQALETIITQKKGCYMSCRSDNTQICGGPLANSLFSIDGTIIMATTSSDSKIPTSTYLRSTE